MIEDGEGFSESSTALDDKPAISSRTEISKVASKKQPPPESTENTRVRQWVIISFWAIVIFFGLPTWWWTTSIHRAYLPLQEMKDWAEGKVYSRLKQQSAIGYKC